MSRLAVVDTFQVAAKFDVAGFHLDALAESEELLAPVHRLLRAFQVAKQTSASLHSPWCLHVSRQDHFCWSHPADDLRQVWTGEAAPGWQVVHYAGPGRRRLELTNDGYIELDLVRCEATIVLSPNAPAKWVGYFTTTLLCQGLLAAGHCFVHAACLAVLERGQASSVLLVAKSGTGKSTTALALADAGWKLMGDDIALVCRIDGGLGAWGFPRVCHIRRPTLQLLPWLNDLPLAPTAIDGTLELPLEALGHRACLPRAGPLKPAAIICLELPNAQEHQLGALDRAAALMHLAQENVQPIEGHHDAVAQQSFTTFAELVQQTPAYRLSVGPSVNTLADFLSHHLRF